MYCIFIFCFICSLVNGFLFDGSQSLSTTCSSIQVDVVFLLDSSGSEGSVNFQKQLHFVKSFVEKFEIGPSNMQVSVVSFSTIVMENFDLKKYQSKYELLAAIDTIPYLSGTTHTDEAITFAVKHSFSAVSGDRTQAPNVIIVLTDGQSSSPSQTMHAAYQAHSAGITTFAIGIRTSDYIGELKYIASDPQNVFQASNFNALDQLQNVLSTKFCEAIVTTTPVVYTTIPTDFSYSSNCRLRPADVVFLLDSSTGEGAHYFQEELNFVKTFVNKFDIGPSDMQISVITYSTRVVENFNFQRYQTKQELLLAIENISYISGSTNTHEALSFALQHSFTQQAGDRAKAPNVIIVLTDGQSTSPTMTKQVAATAQQKGIEIFAVGTGDNLSFQELLSIASGRQYVSRVANLDALYRLQSELTTTFCEGKA
ncbi:matrilin-1-like [Crassostrea virginica]